MSWKFRYNLGSLAIFLLVLNISLFSIIVIKTESMATEEIASIRIGFDETHNPSWYTGSYITYGLFRNTLMINHDVTILTSVINEVVLSELEILIIVASQTLYTTGEIDIIEHWVRSGGSILLISDYQESTAAAVMGIADRFGFKQKFDSLHDSDDYVVYEPWVVFSSDNIQSHEITTDVNRIEIYGGGGIIRSPSNVDHLVTTDTDGTASWSKEKTEANGIAIASVLDNNTYQNGRIAIFTDGNFLTGFDQDNDGTVNFFDSDNDILALNTIKWLADTVSGPYQTSAKPSINLSYPYHVVIFLVVVSSLLLNITKNFRKKNQQK